MTPDEEASLRQDNRRLEDSNAALQAEIRHLRSLLRSKEPKATTPTPMMRKLLTFIGDYQRAHDGVSPSYREMAAGIGIASTGGVDRLVKGLEERGLLQRLHHRARAMTIVNTAEFAQ